MMRPSSRRVASRRSGSVTSSTAVPPVPNAGWRFPRSPSWMSHAAALSLSRWPRHPPAMTRRSHHRRRKRPESTSTGSNCVSIGIACRRRSPIIAWTATMRRRNILMKSSASICTRSPSCGATPTACFSTPARTRSAVGHGASMMGKSTFKPCSRFEDLGTRAREPHLHLYTAVVWHITLKRRLRLWSSSTGKTRPSRASSCWALLIRIWMVINW